MDTPSQVSAGSAPNAPWRTLDEVKAELMRRAGRLNPFEDIRREDAEQVANALTSLDRDLWAELWSRIGLAYEAQGDERAKQGAPGRELASLYSLAFDYCRVGRYPVAEHAGQEGSHTSIRCACSARRRSTSSRR